MFLNGQLAKYANNIYNIRFLLFPKEKNTELFHQILQKVLKGC